MSREDAISRQAAIDAIGNVPYHDDRMVFEALSHAQRDVALLPPVTPQIKIENAPLSMIKSIREKENKKQAKRYCDNCLHKNVCGLEGANDEAMTYCADKLEEVK